MLYRKKEMESTNKQYATWSVLTLSLYMTNCMLYTSQAAHRSSICLADIGSDLQMKITALHEGMLYRKKDTESTDKRSTTP